METAEPKYRLRFFLDYYHVLWGDNDAALDKYGGGIDPEDLPISNLLAKEIEDFNHKLDAKFNGYIETLKDHPDLRLEADLLLQKLKTELGPEFEIVDEMQETGTQQ